MVDGDERWEKSEKREYKGMEYSRRRGTEDGEEEVETKIKGVVNLAARQRRRETLGRSLGSATSSTGSSLFIEARANERHVSASDERLAGDREDGLAWKPVLIAWTDRVDPHEEQVMKKRRLSLVKVVSGDLQVLQVTYSTMYRRRTFSICSIDSEKMRCTGATKPDTSVTLTAHNQRRGGNSLCWKRPLMTNRALPSTEPLVPNSANKNWMTCSG